MNTPEINWQEPPSVGTVAGKGKWQRTADELKAHPGQWALLAENAHSSTAGLLNRYGLETRCVSAGMNYKHGRADLYARWPEGDAK